MAAIYDRFMAESERACLSEWRQVLLEDADGDVLEIGAGTGVNLGHYPTSGMRSLTLTEPDPHMRKKLEAALKRAVAPCPTSISDAGASTLPFEDETFDTVVSTLVLCSVDRLHGSLDEVARVLRPGGQLLFLEHVGADQRTFRRKAQETFEPVWKQVAGGCHLTRDTEMAIEDAGLLPLDIRRESMRKALPILRPTIRGRAVKPAAQA